MTGGKTATLIYSRKIPLSRDIQDSVQGVNNEEWGELGDGRVSSWPSLWFVLNKSSLRCIQYDELHSVTSPKKGLVSANLA